jgi:hypothetical protein
METATLPSTFVLTLLMCVGLFFFIRASTKDRTEAIVLRSDQAAADLMSQLQKYFGDRAYKVVGRDTSRGVVELEGSVRPSLFLAIFLSFLAAIGLWCLYLTITYAVPQIAPWGLMMIGFAPLAGLFNWRTAGRTEKVAYKIEADGDSDGRSGTTTLTVQAHRDEILSLREAIVFEVLEDSGGY